MSRKKKRCLSASPGLGWRCELKRGHTYNGAPSYHRAAFATWSPDEGTTWTGPQSTQLASSTGSTMATPGDHQHQNPGDHILSHYHVPPLLDPGLIGDAYLKQAGQGLLAGLRANFTAMDEAEKATDPHRAELAQWWRDTAEAEIEQTVDKAIEYGATDLVDIGRTLARVAGRELEDAEAAEWGIFFYLEGKLSRWRSALERGDVPSYDTLLDIGVYARMAQRVRQTGSWPGTRETVFHLMCDPNDPCGPSCTATKTYPNRSAG